MSSYASLCTEFYDLDKPAAPAAALAFYAEQARRAGGRALEPMCGSGRFLLPMWEAGLVVDGVDSSPAMLNACRAHARKRGLAASIHLQELASLALPHRYAMAFIPSGSIGLIVNDTELRMALARVRSHLEPNGVLFLELSDDDGAFQTPTTLGTRTVVGDGGESIAYACIATRLTNADVVQFAGTYTKRRANRVIGTENEDLLLRLYPTEAIVAMLATCGFTSIAVSGASAHSFLADSGCSLVTARV